MLALEVTQKQGPCMTGEDGIQLKGSCSCWVLSLAYVDVSACTVHEH